MNTKDIIMGKWHISKLIGRGSSGQVYEVFCTDSGKLQKAALKVITISKKDPGINVPTRQIHRRNMVSV